jgi:endonuclease-3 related protein
VSSPANTLMAMYRAMRERFGPQHWWPSAAGAETAEGKLEICVGAILTQNTNWANVRRAIEALRRAGRLDAHALHALPAERLAELIRPAGYFNVKARRLKNFVARLHETAGGDIEAFLGRPVAALREDLLAVRGVGRETADSMILYAAGKPCFVVDAYTRRIALRHRLIAPEDDYEAIKALFEWSLPEDAALWNDYHAQLVAVGKAHCRPRAACAGCPLEAFDHDADERPA